MTPDFNRLRTFYFIYTYGNISSAAKQLNITVSAVSQQLKKLEEELGTRLFSRPHKRMVPTSAADLLYESVKPFVLTIANTISHLQEAKANPTGLLRIGAPVEFGKIVMPQLIADYITKYPNVSFSLKLGRTSELLPKIRNGELDFAFIDTFPTRRQRVGIWSEISLTPMFNEVVVLACSRSYLEKNMALPLCFENLAKQRFIAQQDDARAIKNWFFHHYQKNCNNPHLVLTVANHQAVVNAIKSGLGLGIIVSQLAIDDIHSGEIVVIKTGKEDAVNTVSLVQLLDKVPSITEKTFQHHVKTVLSK